MGSKPQSRNAAGERDAGAVTQSKISQARDAEEDENNEYAAMVAEDGDDNDDVDDDVIDDPELADLLGELGNAASNGRPSHGGMRWGAHACACSALLSAPLALGAPAR